MRKLITAHLHAENPADPALPYHGQYDGFATSDESQALIKAHAEQAPVVSGGREYLVTEIVYRDGPTEVYGNEPEAGG